MGQYLSSKVATHVDTSKDVISPGDTRGEKTLGLLMLFSFYGIAMIWSTCALVDHWRGLNGTRKIGFASVITAIIMSIAWPVVLVFLMIGGIPDVVMFAKDSWNRILGSPLWSFSSRAPCQRVK